ncbi:MAG: hypothetical protein ACOCUL_04515, partial [Bacteroidota bacterium]
VASAGFFILLVSYFFIAKKITPIRSIKINSILLGWLGRRLTKGVLISSLFFITAAFALMRYFSISLSNLRIFSYGTGKISSVGTRMDILTNNFLTHFAYNPFFGNAQVEIETTGGGTYIHSLLSILTHTGIVGLIFFMVFLFAIYNDITKNTSNDISLYTNKHYSLFRLLSVSIILTYAILWAFFNWMPLWFGIGLYGISFCDFQKQHHVSMKEFFS